MPWYLTPPTTTDDTDRAAEPPGRKRRFTDQRGIALQTVIIMVVMLAIAGGIAAVLLSRGQTASDQLESSALGAPAATYTNASFCRSAGFDWDGTKTGANANENCRYPDAAACTAAGGKTYAAKTGGQPATGKFCRAGSSGASFLGAIV